MDSVVNRRWNSYETIKEGQNTSHCSTPTVFKGGKLFKKRFDVKILKYCIVLSERGG